MAPTHLAGTIHFPFLPKDFTSTTCVKVTVATKSEGEFEIAGHSQIANYFGPHPGSLLFGINVQEHFEGTRLDGMFCCAKPC